METAGEKSGASASARLRRPTGAALNWAILLVLVVIWGSTFAGIRIGVETIDPAWLVTGRLLGASALLAIWMTAMRALNGRRRADASAPVTRKAILWFAFIGIAGTATPFILFAHAAESIGSAVMAICNGATPFATAFAAWRTWIR